MNDKEKLDTWNRVCMENGWSKPRELEKWILQSGVKFSNSGSSVPDVVMMIMNKYNLEVVLNAVEGEGLATLILEAIAGVLTFASVDLERMFWYSADERLRDEFSTSIPEDLFPKYLKKLNDPHQYDLFS